MRVKICGLMRPTDVEAALTNGADSLGFVVESPSSPRNLALNRAQQLMSQVPVFATKVAVTSSTDPSKVLKICYKLEPDAVQLHQHRRELVGLIRKKHPGTQVILATPIIDHSSVAKASSISGISDAVLADTKGIGPMGGTGRTHDWGLTSILRNKIFPHPLILAGGLTPRNVRLAIRKVRPYAVDVSTGVERKVGVKDHQKIREFIKNAKELRN